MAQATGLRGGAEVAGTCRELISRKVINPGSVSSINVILSVRRQSLDRTQSDLKSVSTDRLNGGDFDARGVVVKVKRLGRDGDGIHPFVE